MDKSGEAKKTVWQHVFGWPTVGAVSVFLLGIGGSLMTAPHPYIADVFFFAGFGLLLAKFWTWEEAKHDTTRKTAMLLTGVTVFTILLFAGSCWLSYYLNIPKQFIAQTVALPTGITIPPAPTAPQTPPRLMADASRYPPTNLHKREQTPEPSESEGAAKSIPMPSLDIRINGDVHQGENNSGCQQNNIGSNGNTLNCTPPVPPPRVASPQNMQRAIETLKTAPLGSSYALLISGGTDEINAFAKQISVLFANSQNVWTAWNGTHIIHNEAGDLGGFGCEVGIVDGHPSISAQIAIKAFKEFGYPCVEGPTMHPPRVVVHGQEYPALPTHPVDIWLSIGTRIPLPPQ